jgi:dTDP-4-amino-4,6-dideoxygalactose transaminase
MSGELAMLTRSAWRDGSSAASIRAVRARPAPFAEPVYVTKPLLPDLEQYYAHLREIWQTGWLSNGGGNHRALESALREHLGAKYLSLFNNGTTALTVACQALELSGEVITTPFTFPATPHVLSWNHITPVFADIDAKTLTLDPSQIEPLITSHTSAILAVHVYGMPCATEEIERIADAHGLRVVYDGAHAFGTKIGGRAITEFGDATMLSFHATKLFHTAEGGALVLRDKRVHERSELMKNFGIKNEFEVAMPGINGKMNELQAALGLLTLRQVAVERLARTAVASVYRERLWGIEGLTFMDLPDNVENSHQYFVVRIDASAPVSRDTLYGRLKEFNVFARKYFYPLCSQYHCYRSLPSADPSRLPTAHRVVEEVLALPYYGALGEDGAHRVCDAIGYIVGEA